MKDGAGTGWFFGTMAASLLFSSVSRVYVMRHVYSKTTEIFPQTGPLSIGFYSTGEPFWGLAEGERILAIWLFKYIYLAACGNLDCHDVLTAAEDGEYWKTDSFRQGPEWLV